MPSYTTAFPSKYVKAEDLAGRRTVTVKAVAFEDVGSGANAGRKLVAYFYEAAKGLVLNKINCDSLAKIAGTDDYERWSGTRAELFPTTTEFNGKRVACIRIDPPTTATTNGAPVVTGTPDQALGF